MPVVHHGSFMLINWNVCSYMPMKTYMHVVMAHQRSKLQCTSDQLREKDLQRTVRTSAVLAPLLFTHTDSVSSLIFNLADKPLILTDLALKLLPNSNAYHLDINLLRGISKLLGAALPVKLHTSTSIPLFAWSPHWDTETAYGVE